jgi:inosine-uridine nucleoside N-ribohydrolase
MADRTKILFDTDIGTDIDDALALAYLLCQERCELLGITTVTGQADKRAEMASAICRHAGRDDVPIHVGCPQALLVRMRQDTAQQAAALGNWPRRNFSSAGRTAIEFMAAAIRRHEGEVTLLAVGPMTNVAVLFATHPELPAMLKGLVLMCGRFFSAMGGEWNAINDPHATAIVYGSGHHAAPPRHVSFGLDVTTRCTMPADDCRRRFAAKALAPVRDFAEVWFQRATHVTFHDPLAAACIFQPDLCRYTQGKVTVSLAEPTAGWTVFDGKCDARPHTVASEVDAEAFLSHFLQTVA